ncbi:glycosyl hydrolase family 1 [Nannochloropsis gaditana]|uniref:Glycosyl hydrolase family 1 n=1 Tax=Nannochloropsis gaditana TaxID=72520 RepID=W7TNI3_9STRA|nr:glycosyl hydrolase family 1 [Nannochloropsis gaditana]
MRSMTNIVWTAAVAFAFLLGDVSADSSAPYPSDFAWGAATAAYQVEGAYNTDGRGMSIWDTFSHIPGKTANGDTGDVADDSYHRYEEDIKLAVEMGITHYRMSISWPRIMPNGKLPLNPKGVAFYNDVINTLLAHNIEPFVTLYHWDLPQALANDSAGQSEGDKLFGKGWLEASVADDFVTYAEACFLQFGDRVSNWLTFNEPLTFVNLGYGSGTHAPGRCSGCSLGGDSATEPYIAAHNVLRAHGKAVARYRQLKAMAPSMLDGKIGITLNCDWGEPFTSSKDDEEAATRFLEFQLAWYADPVFFGTYPASMVAAVGDRLPKFTAEEAAQLKGSWDFFGLNHYTSKYVKKPDYPAPLPGMGTSWYADAHTTQTDTSIDGILIGPLGDSSWLHVVPWGFRKMLNWVAERYGNPGIYVTENGCDVPNESKMSLAEALDDKFRVDFYRGYLSNMAEAMKDGVKVKGYFAWSLLDNFEWADGYSKRFGLHYVDYSDNLKRYKKSSAKWYHDYIRANSPGKSHKLRMANPNAGKGGGETAARHRTLKASIASAVLGFMAALVVVAAVMTGRALVKYNHEHQQRHSHVSGSHSEDEEEDHPSVRSDLLSPRIGLGGKSVSFTSLGPMSSAATGRPSRRSPRGVHSATSASSRMQGSVSMGVLAQDGRGLSSMGPSKSMGQLTHLSQRKSHTNLEDLALQSSEPSLLG